MAKFTWKMRNELHHEWKITFPIFNFSSYGRFLSNFDYIYDFEHKNDNIF